MHWSREQMAVFAALHIRQLLFSGLRPWHRIVTIWPPERTWRRTAWPGEPFKSITIQEELPFGRALPALMPNFIPIWSDIRNPAHDAEVLARVRPDFVISTPSRLLRIGRAAAERHLSIRPKVLDLANETVTSAAKSRLAELFDCKALVQYGAAEFGTIGMECSYGRGVHLHEDFIVCEVLKDGEAAGPGETGELVLTPLHNKAMPLIRIRTGDLVRRSDSGVCECGSWMTRLDQIKGRSADGLAVFGGGRTTPLDAAELVEDCIGVCDYRLEQRTLQSFSLMVHPKTRIGGESARNLKGRLTDLVGVDVSLEVSEGSEEDFVGKNRPIMSRV